MVLGMHRSGTSALTRVLGLLGADLPKNLLPPSGTNEIGYWESRELVAIHEEILSTGGSKWHDWRAFNPEWYQSPVAGTYKSRILDVLRKDFSNSPLFAIKDPRICRLWPLWHEVLADFGASPGVVIPFRNPLEVAYSLKQRNGFLPAKSCLLWLRHVLDAESASRGVPRAIVCFDALLTDWQGVASSVGSRLGVKWPRRGALAEVEIERHLNPRLRHHFFAPEQLAARADVVDWIKETHSSLLRLTVAPDHKASMARLDRIRDEFERGSRAFGAALADGEVELASRDTEIVNITASRDALAQHISDLRDDQQRLSEAAEHATTKLREELESALALHSAEREKTAEIADRLRDAEVAERNAAEEVRQLASEREALQRQVSDLSHEQQQEEANTAAAVARAKEALDGALAALSAERQRTAEQSDRLADLEEVRQLAKVSRDAIAAEVRQLAFEREALLQRHDETVAALETLRSEKLVAESARADLDRTLSRALQDQRALTTAVERISGELGRIQDCASARESGQAMKHEAEIHALRSQLLDSETAHANRAQQGSWTALLPMTLRHHSPARRLVRSGLFDVEWYRTQYSDVPQSKFGAANHYLRTGFCKGYKPNPLFDTRWYLQLYEDVRRSGMNPLLHYLDHGSREGRDPGPDFDTQFYLEANPDVRAASKNPLAHYLNHGRHEGRLPLRPRLHPGETAAVVKTTEPGIKPPPIPYAQYRGRELSRRKEQLASALRKLSARKDGYSDATLQMDTAVRRNQSDPHRGGGGGDRRRIVGGRIGPEHRGYRRRHPRAEFRRPGVFGSDPG
jgi:hypothetical protein